MELQGYLEQWEKDPTWNTARGIVSRCLLVPENLIYLVRTGWSMGIDLPEFKKLIAFSGLNPACLVNAAGLPTDGRRPRVQVLEKAIETLGIRYSIVVLAINATVRSILKSKPTVGWRKLLEAMMTDIEIGYNFGARAGEIGVESGVLAGFAKNAGLGLLMAYDMQAFKKYLDLQRRFGRVGSAAFEDLFGCEPYQVSALLVQRLGFGVTPAIGTACGLSNLRTKQIKLPLEVHQWQGAYSWIDALREGRDYPAEVEVRNLFPALKPYPDRKTKNPILEMLYVEVVKVRREGSSWTWHLPRPDYDRTREVYGL